jgi:hypothetical protein
LKAKIRLSTNIVHKRGGCRNLKITKPKQNLVKSSGLIEQRLKLTSMPCEDKIDGKVCSKNVSRRKSGFTSQKVDLDHLQNHSIRTQSQAYHNPSNGIKSAQQIDYWILDELLHLQSFLSLSTP